MNNSALQKKVNISEFGVITKAEFCQKAKAAGWRVEAKEMSGYQNGEYNRTKFNRMTGDEQAAYEARLNKTKTVYSIYPPAGSGFYDISKTEFDYFNQLAN